MWWNDYVGIPFKSNGRDRSGCDCWGLVVMVYRDVFNLEISSFSEWKGDANNIHQVADLFAKEDVEWTQWRKLHRSEVQPGDLLIFTSGGFPIHVGISIGQERMLHITKGINATVEPYTGVRWSKRFDGAYRHV